MKTWCLLQFALNLTAISCSHTVSVSSTPADADTYLMDAGSTRRMLIGKTPLSLPQNRENHDYYHVEINKAGFMPQIVIAPFTSTFNEDTDIKVVLRKQDSEWFKTSMRGMFTTETNDIVGQFLDLQEKILQGNDLEAERLLASMGKQYANLSVFHSLSGAYYWKRNDLAEAKAAYRRALKIDSKDMDARKMINVINGMTGGL